jgi:hypothetical protein
LLVDLEQLGEPIVIMGVAGVVVAAILNGVRDGDARCDPATQNGCMGKVGALCTRPDHYPVVVVPS